MQVKNNRDYYNNPVCLPFYLKTLQPMKKIIPAFAVLLCCTALLNSCTVSKNSITINNADVKNTNDLSAPCFIQLNDGTIRQFTNLKLVTGVLTTPHLLADEKEIINGKDILAYQNHKHYAVSAKSLTSTKNGMIAAETLPGFAVKVLAGKLNVYCRRYYNGGNTAEEYFLQNGNDGNIISYSKAVLKNMIKEDTKALEYFNGKSKILPKSKRILAAVEMYNNGQMMTKN
jgi:hypothetical protein